MATILDRQTPAGASFALTERRINAVVAVDATRQREPLPAPLVRSPIPSSVGLAEFGSAIPISSDP